MAQEDQIKWDKKYTDNIKLREKRVVSKKLEKYSDTVDVGKALDVACGTGRNSIYLAQKGFSVDALDISKVAIEHLNSLDIDNIQAQEVDLDEYDVSLDSYDLILMCNFLDRALIRKLLDGLKVGGILIVETYMHHPMNTKPNLTPEFLLQKEELKSFLKEGFELVDYDEFDNDTGEMYRMRKQSIVIKRK
jgi:SAM-dependent methyltransferase